MTAQKILYTETFPSKISRTFIDSVQYWEFYNTRFQEVCKKLDFFNPLSKYNYSDWKHSRVRLNKDGTPRKYYGADHLHTKSARKKQRIKFGEFLKRKRQENLLNEQRRQSLALVAYAKSVKVLLKEDIDISLLDIRMRK